MSEMSELEDSNHRVFFQNAEGNINMGIFFNDPDVELDEIYWYNAMAKEIAETIEKDEELIAVDEELGTHSCYVELHRLDKKNHNSIHHSFYSHPVGSNGRNNIIAVTPMKFLPIKEFEKRQKSINRNQNLSIMSSMITKIEF